MSAERRPRPVFDAAKSRADVKGFDQNRRRVAIVTDWGYTVADICAGELKLKDIVEGDVETVGSSTWVNLSTGKPVTVNITHVQATKVSASRLLERP